MVSSDITLHKLGKVGAMRVDLEVTEFDKLVFEKGLKVYWERALECPCRLNGQTEQPDPTCDACEGFGHLYVKPSEARQRKAAAAKRRNRKKRRPEA